jgi:hypothetical protein
MSTWTSKLPLILLLAGCVQGGAPGASRPVAILGGEVKVAGPRGYCVDTKASQSGADSAVMIIGRCSDASDVPPAAITATVGEAGSAAVMAAGPDPLAQYFASTEGRAALSRDGRADAVVVQDIQSVDGVIILHLTDSAIGEYWRAVMGVQGRLVTLAVTPPEGQPLTVAEGKLLLDRAIAALRAANPAVTL